MTEKAQEIVKQNEQEVDEEVYNKFERDAKRNWDIFYKNNKTNGYKDRHYIQKEFPDLIEAIKAN